MMNNEKEKLLDIIRKTTFAVIDAQLFLDTHPNCEEALEYHRKMSKMRNDAYRKYEEMCGPLNIYDEEDRGSWTWNESKWPWEGGNC